MSSPAFSDPAPFDRPPARGRRPGFVVALILIAFVAGCSLASYAIYAGWLSRLNIGAQPPQTGAGTDGAGFTPAQPLTSTGAAPAVDPAALVTREAALAAQLAALEARTATVATDAAAAGAQATRAEALMVAFATRRAIDGGTGLGYLEEQLRSRFVGAQPRAVAVLIQAARTPVTIEDLRQALDAIAPDLQSASGRDWFADTRRELRNLIVLREEGTPSTAPADRLARARRLLDDGRVDAARAEIARMPGAAQAGNWLVAARRYALAHQALDVVETAAILGQATGQPLAPVRGDPIAR
ncbi:hypothetical protein [Sphingomonas sp. CFBP 8760]|uniref:hypothetical protein n=1 Tax=Sphingomonas sp. CFBP 8760 TaxID=2775282 RepID=UPI00177CB15A|nr:hypothetical protein [Sphingomonas sp. CFBP 8760]MBD8547250.1 hypothetical protein [Sphingomonas sp. CFBP 8760]